MILHSRVKKLVLLSMALPVLAVGFLMTGNAEAAFSVEYSVGFSPDDFNFEKIQDYDFIYLQERGYLSHVSEPMLPMKDISIALPEGMAVENLRIIDAEYQDLNGEFNILPSQPPLQIGQDENDVVFVAPDAKIYGSSQPYPGTAAKFIRESDLAGQAIAEVAVYPLQYIPNEKKLRLLTKIIFVLEGPDGYQYGDYLPANCAEKDKDMYRELLKATVANKDAVALAAAPAAMKLSTSLPSTTNFGHIIITSSSNAPYYQSLAEWHTKRGLRDTIITTEYINANYSGTDQKERIRNFIIDAHQNWGTFYILLGGEMGTIPFAYREYENTSVPSDSYYGDYDDDWQYEVFVGRMTAEGATEINRFVNKVMKYETDPPLLGYANHAALLGMDLTISTDPPYFTLTRGEYLKIAIENHIPPRFGVTTIYDTDNSNHRDDFIAALNAGQNVVNHCDHANYSVICTGDRNHNWCFYTGDVYNLTNYNEYANIFSLGCYANRMDIEDAISEHFVFGTDSTGAVSFTGNTRSGWFYVGDPMSLSSDLDLKWWICMFDYNWYKLGEALAFCKTMSNVDAQFPFAEWTLNLLGEPSMPIWSDIPTAMNVTYPSEIGAIPQTYPVHVEKFGGVDISEAYVCLWLNGDIYERGLTDINGDISFDISPTTNGTMYVTVTKQNYIPYQGQAAVTGNVPPTCNVPGDTMVFLCEPMAISLPVGCSDDDGNLESGPELVRGPGEIVGSNWQYTPSIGEDSVEVTVRCTDSLGSFCETTFIVYFDFNDTPVCSLPNDTSITQVAPITELSLPVSADDADGNMVQGYITNGPGIISNGYWVYTPANDETIAVTVQFDDSCGAYCRGSFNIDYSVFACGDPNADLTVNIFDISYLITYLYLEGPAPDPMLTGDSNGDGVVNIFDITYIIDYLYRSGPPPICN
jgi:hypothetical protein